MNATLRIADEVCCLLALDEYRMPWRDRLATVLLVLKQAGCVPRLACVRGVAFSRSAQFQLGGPLIPRHEGELQHFDEQVGHCMRLLGFDEDEPHVVIVVDGVLVDVADSRDWRDRGVILRPVAVPCIVPLLDQWTVGPLRYGVVVAYQPIASSIYPVVDGEPAHDVITLMRAAS